MAFPGLGRSERQTAGGRWGVGNEEDLGWEELEGHGKKLGGRR